MSTMVKTHKKSFGGSQALSDFSDSSFSSSSTLALTDWFLEPPPPPEKPWPLKAISQLSVKCKKSTLFRKRKGSGAKELDGGGKPEIWLYASQCFYTTVPDVLDISREAVEATKALLEEEREKEGRDMLPDPPRRMLKKAGSSNVLSSFGRPQYPSRLHRMGSTPDLRKRTRRASGGDPFYLESYLSDFPKPPRLPGKVVTSPEEYSAREPVNQRVRQGSNSSFSMPTSMAYPGMRSSASKPSNVIWLHRPVAKDVPPRQSSTSFTTKSSDSDVAFPTGQEA